MALPEGREPCETSPGSSNPRGNVFSRLRPGQRKGHNRSVTWVSESLSERDHSIPLSMPGRDSEASASADGLKARVDARKVDGIASKSSLSGKRSPSKPNMVAKITSVDCMAPATEGSPPAGSSPQSPLEAAGSSKSSLKDTGKERRKDGASKPPPLQKSDSSSTDVVPRFGAWHNTRLDASKISLLFKERAAKQSADGENGDQPGSEATASRVAAITAAGTSRNKKKASLKEDSPFIDLQAELAAATAEIQEMLAAERAGSSSSRREDISTANMDKRFRTDLAKVNSSADVDCDEGNGRPTEPVTTGSFGRRENDSDQIDADVAGNQVVDKTHSAEAEDLVRRSGSDRMVQDQRPVRMPIRKPDGDNARSGRGGGVSDLPVFGSWTTGGGTDAVEISKVFKEKASPVKSASGAGSQGGRVIVRQASADGLSGSGQITASLGSGTFPKPERGRNPELVDATPSWQSESAVGGRGQSGGDDGHDPVSFVAFLPQKSSSEDAEKGGHRQEEGGQEKEDVRLVDAGTGRRTVPETGSSSSARAGTGTAGTAGKAGAASRSDSHGSSASVRLPPPVEASPGSTPSIPAFGSWRKKAAVKSSEISQLFRPRTLKADPVPERVDRGREKQPPRVSSSSPLPRPQSQGDGEDREKGRKENGVRGREDEVEPSGELIPPAVPAFGAWRAGAVNASNISQIFQATKTSAGSGGGGGGASEQAREQEGDSREVGPREVPAFGTWRGSAGVNADTISQIFKGKATAATEASAPALARSDSSASDGGNSMDNSPSVSKSPSAGDEELQAASRYPANRFAASGRSNSGGRRKKVALSRSRQDLLSSDLEKALSALAEMEGADECIAGEDVREGGDMAGGEQLEGAREETAAAAADATAAAGAVSVKLTDVPRGAELGSFRFAGSGQEEPVSAVFGPPRVPPPGPAQAPSKAEGSKAPGSPASPKALSQSPNSGAASSVADKSFRRDGSQGGKQSLQLSAVWGVVEEGDEGKEEVSSKEPRADHAGAGGQSAGKQGGIFARKRLEIKAPRERDGMDAEKAMMALIGCGFGDTDEIGGSKGEMDGMSAGNVSDLLKEAKQRFKKGLS